ncbi:preprotein translocase subunit SecE [bacterium]|jgi:preprotein translocase SecE subunit|nr:MAG: preprotein translocase subunit SecE [bacterium]
MKKITRYIKSSMDELKRVIWPTRKQATVLTVVVLGFTAAVALYLAVFDYIFRLGLERLITR